jgi:ABC-type amino acid transport substrate-binding protein
MIKYIITCIVTFFLFSCDSKSKGNEIYVGISPDNPPYEFISNGTIEGFDIDLLNEISKEINIKFILQDIQFDGLIPALKSNRINIIASGLSKTEERAKSIDFSDSYIETEVAILYNNSIALNSASDLNNVTIGVQDSTTWHEIAKQLKNNNNTIEIKSLHNNLLLIEELKINNVSAVILEKNQAYKFVEKYGDIFKYIVLNEYKSSLAYGYNKDFKYKQQINDAINKLQSSGVISTLEQKWNLK